MLSHERMGAIEHFQVTTYRCPVDRIEDDQGNPIGMPFDPDPILARADPVISSHLQSFYQRHPEPRGVEMLRRRRDEFEFMYRTRHLGAFATAAYMATHSYIKTWEKFLEYAELRRQQITMLLLGGYILPAHRPNAPNAALPQDTRQFLSVVDALRPRKPVRRKGSFPILAAGDDDSDPRDTGLILVGYFFLEWFIPSRHVNAVHLLYVGKDSVDDGADSPFKVMFGAGVARIVSDIEKFGHPEPEHLWARVSRVDVAERTRYILMLEKLGFFEIEEYCEVFSVSFEELEMKFESFILAEDEGRLYTILVCRWEDIKASVLG
ncbi:hypothetical protein HDU67_005569 [Dinochytrium kinnereticum]|nr:hypothetical protein HDU67_005569 [Dinochytrium kinnereticum]